MNRNIKAGYAQSGGFSLNALTKDELDSIHRGTLEVLNETGVFVQAAAAREVLRKAGCKIDEDNAVVKIPGHLVEDAIMSAPEAIILKGRTKDKDVVMGGGRVGFTNFGEAIKVQDIDTGEIRETLKKDICDMARIADALGAIDIFERPAGCHDMPQHVAALHNYHAMLTNCTKHVAIGPLDLYQAKKMQEMAKIVIAGVYGEKEAEIRNPVTFTCCPVSPLRLVEDCCDIIMHAAHTDNSILFISVAMSGGSTPVNLAGTLVTHNCEVLAGIVLSQVINRGLPVIYGSSSTSLDLKSALATCGSPEMGMVNAAVATMARNYKLPCWVAGT